MKCGNNVIKGNDHCENGNERIPVSAMCSVNTQLHQRTIFQLL